MTTVGAHTTPAIRIRGARKVYPAHIGRPQRIAVKDASFDVEAGRIHGLLGPNGAGKTTTLKMLMGLVRPTGGSFEISGRDSTRPSGRRSVGFLPEQPYFPQTLTALNLLRLYGRLVGIGKTDLDGHIDELLDMVGLAGQERLPVSKFSRGMLQRLGLAQAMLGKPEVLILDEPASGLDPIGQRDVRNIMQGLADGGTTILLSSHQLSEIEAVCEQVTILGRGEVAAEGAIEDLLNVQGQSSVRAEGFGDGLPEALASMASDVAMSGTVSMFSVETARIPEAVAAIAGAGGTVVSILPKRESLEDYFSKLLAGLDETPEAKT